MLRRSLIAATALALASCTTPATSTLISLEAADSAALAGLIAYEKTPNASPAVIAQAKVYQTQVDTALAPLEAAAASGGDVGNAAEQEAASAAMAALVAYETAHNINPGA